VNWPTIGLFIAVGVVGSFAGRRIGGRINQVALRRSFAGFLIVMGTFVLAMEGRSLWAQHSAGNVPAGSQIPVAAIEEVAQ